MVITLGWGTPKRAMDERPGPAEAADFCNAAGARRLGAEKPEVDTTRVTAKVPMVLSERYMLVRYRGEGWSWVGVGVGDGGWFMIVGFLCESE
jgi:hypothetical protein